MGCCYIQLPDDDAYRLVLCDSQVKHSLVASEYNTRRAECEAGVARLQAVYPYIRALRDVTPAMLREHSDLLPPVTLQRCRYVVEETQDYRSLKPTSEHRTDSITTAG